MNKHADDIQEIRQLMERSTKFFSLSGKAGIYIGLLAMLGSSYLMSQGHFYLERENTFLCWMVACVVLLLSLVLSFFLTQAEARKRNDNLLSKPAKRIALSMLIPLSVGGLLALMLIYEGAYIFVVPCTLIFYGLALENASKHTHEEIRYLGWAQVVLGLSSYFIYNWSILLWAIGFGVLHIIYGVVMQNKYK